MGLTGFVALEFVHQHDFSSTNRPRVQPRRQLERSSGEQEVTTAQSLSAPHCPLVTEERAVDRRHSMAALLTLARLGTNGQIKADSHVVLKSRSDEGL